MATNEDEVTRLYGLFASASIASPCPVRCLDGSPGRARCCSRCLWSLSCVPQLPGGVRLVPPVCGTHGSQGHWELAGLSQGSWSHADPRSPRLDSIGAGSCCCAAAPMSLLCCALVSLRALPLGAWGFCGTVGSLGCTQGGKKNRFTSAEAAVLAEMCNGSSSALSDLPLARLPPR